MSEEERTRDDDAPVELRRSLSLPLITLYGVGTIVGGGIYALLGKVAGAAGSAAPLAFLLAAGVATLCAFSFAELSARFPVSAGEATYVAAAFRSLRARWLGPLVGGLVILTGTVSAATLARAVGAFLVELTGAAPVPCTTAVVAFLALVAAWGITESVTLAAGITLVEVGGLLAVVLLRGDVLAELPARWPEVVQPGDAGWSGITLGAFLAFYAYIGFEDMVNVAEEVQRPRRNLPIAILVALAVTSLLYLLVSLVAVLAVSPVELAESVVPLADLVGAESGRMRPVLSVISVLAGVNGALIQIVMAARIVYGLRSRSRATAWLGVVHARTRTPVRATLVLSAFVLVLALWLPLVTLAALTSTIILVVFALVNLALIRIRRRESRPPLDVPHVPLWVPALGLVMCVLFLLLRAAALLGG